MFSFIGATALTGSSVVDGSGQIFLHNVFCIGSESRLIDCTHRGIGVHNCDHSEDAGVRCTGKYNVFLSDKNSTLSSRK